MKQSFAITATADSKLIYSKELLTSNEKRDGQCVRSDVATAHKSYSERPAAFQFDA